MEEELLVQTFNPWNINYLLRNTLYIAYTSFAFTKMNLIHCPDTTFVVCKRWRDLSQDSWHMIKTLDLSPFTWGFTCTDKMRTALLRKILLKCGRFLTRINLNDSSQCLSQSTLTIIGKLCPNLTNIDVTALTVCASGIRTLANNCRNITKFNLGPSTYSCDNELKCLFKLNQNLEYLAITKNSILGKCLLCLPEQTMNTIILDHCDYLQDTHLSLVNRLFFTVTFHYSIDNIWYVDFVTRRH